MVFSMAIDPTATSTLYAGTVIGPSSGIFKTTNAGGTWVPINTGLPTSVNSAIVALALDRRAPNTLYAAIENAGVYKTTDGGASVGGCQQRALGAQGDGVGHRSGDSRHRVRGHARPGRLRELRRRRFVDCP